MSDNANFALPAFAGTSEAPCSVDYVSFGDEWRMEIMKMRKCDIIEMLRAALLTAQELEDDIDVREHGL